MQSGFFLCVLINLFKNISTWKNRKSILLEIIFDIYIHIFKFTTSNRFELFSQTCEYVPFNKTQIAFCDLVLDYSCNRLTDKKSIFFIKKHLGRRLGIYFLYRNFFARFITSDSCCLYLKKNWIYVEISKRPI